MKIITVSKDLKMYQNLVKNNKFNHPHKIIIKRLKQLNIPYFVTNKKGNITKKIINFVKNIIFYPICI